MATFLPYGRQSISEADIAAVVDVLRSPFLTQGPAVPAFEQALAQRVGACHGVAMNSATSALHIACLALGLGPDDRLWTTPITFVASANCGRYCGAEVDFVDIDPDTGLISLEELKHKLKQAEIHGNLPKVLIPVHLSGTSCAMEPMAALADQYGVKIVEDASHAIGGLYKEQPVGNCRYSAITVFSFHPVKIITTGEGGLATTNDPVLAQRMAELRSHGIVREPERFTKPPAGAWTYEQQLLGFNYRMTDIQAALGLSQLQRLDEIVAERNRQRWAYEALLGELPVKFLEVPEDVLSSLHLGIVRLQSASPEQHRDVFKAMRSTGIGVQLHYSPVHLQPYYRKLGFSEGDFPEAEAYANSAISLPLFPGLTQLDQEQVHIALSHSLHEQGLL